MKDVLTSVKKTEESLRRLKNLREKTTTTSQSITSGISDDDKIRLQLHVDISFWTIEIEKLGINCNTVDMLNELNKLVENCTNIKIENQS